VTAAVGVDARGVRVDAPSAEALDAFARAQDSFVSFRGLPLSLIEPVLERWPAFCEAHLLKAFVLLGLGERRFAAAAARSLEAARALLAGGNERTNGLFAAAQALYEGSPDEAGRRLDGLLRANPRDLLALHLGHSVDFNLGRQWNLRNRVARVLPFWKPEDPGYPFVLGMHAFGLEECNEYPEAERVGRESLSLVAANPWAVHAVAHVLEMQGRVEEGIEHLRSRQSDWAVDSPFAYHNWWHLALFHLDVGDIAAVLELYDEQIDAPDANFALARLDATALLWRLHLLDIDVADRWAAVAAWWRGSLEREAGFNAFNDFHAALAFCAVADPTSLATLSERQHAARETATPHGRAVLEQVGIPLVAAVAARNAGELQRSAETLVEVRDSASAFGGSHAQRDLITLTLIDGATRGGARDLARLYLNERLVEKAASPLGWRLQEHYAL